MVSDDRKLTENPRTPVHAVSLLDRSDPQALINILPPALQTALESAYESDPALFGMDERTLYKHLSGMSRRPTITDNRLRLKFWNEYDRAQSVGNGKEMNITAILSGICSRPFFYDHYLSKPENVAWMLCIPASYEVVMEESLQFGLEQMRDILALPIEKDGKINTKLAELKAKITDMLHTRIKGAVVQKNLNINATPSQVQQAGEELTMEDIQRRLKEIEKKKAQAMNGGAGFNGSERVVEAEIVGP
jgi:hypothetical protein